MDPQLVIFAIESAIRLGIKINEVLLDETSSRALVLPLGSLFGDIDTGLDYTHPDLAANVWSAPSAFSVTIGGQVINCAMGTHGFNAITRTCDPMDDNGHGTSVAGVIAATANSIGVTGLCNRCRIMPVKALAANGTGFWTVAAKAIVWAADHGADVINLSFGGLDPDPAQQDAVAYALSRGAVVVAAAGNESSRARE